MRIRSYKFHADLKRATRHQRRSHRSGLRKKTERCGTTQSKGPCIRLQHNDPIGPCSFPPHRSYSVEDADEAQNEDLRQPPSARRSPNRFLYCSLLRREHLGIDCRVLVHLASLSHLVRSIAFVLKVLPAERLEAQLPVPPFSPHAVELLRVRGCVEDQGIHRGAEVGVKPGQVLKVANT